MLKRHLLVLLAMAAVLLTACSSGDEAASEGETTTDSAGGFMIQDGDALEVHYVGTLDDGSTFDSSRERATPFAFTVGTEEVIGGFDEAVLGLKVGESRVVRILPDDAYGERDEGLVIELPYGSDQADVAVGDEVALNTGQPAVILEVKEGTVVLDANHKLAGQALTFDIEILSITRP